MSSYVDQGVKPQRTAPKPRRPRPALPARPRPPRPPLWARLSLIIGAVVVIISGVTVVAPALLSQWLFKEPVGDTIPDDIKGTDISGAINFLLLGIDNPDVPGQGDRRADSIVLVHIPATHDQVFMISFPRDTEAVIPAHPSTGLDADWTTKINAAFFVGAKVTGDGPDVWSREGDLSPEGRARGAALTMRAINNLVPGGLGLTFNGWATIDFDGFRAVVEALGGVRICVDADFYSIHYYPNGRYSGDPLWRGLNNEERAGGDYGDGYHYVPGCRDMEPWQALDYSRQRYGLPNSDYDRQRHQQQLLKAIVEKAASTDTVTNLDTVGRLRDAAGDLLTLDLGGHELLDWVWTLKSLRSDDIVMIKTNGGELCEIPGSTEQCLFPETLDLLRAVKQDTIFEFLTAHPDWVATDQ